MTRKTITITTILATSIIAFTLVGCDDSSKNKMDTDPEAPQPPVDNEEVNSAKATTEQETLELVVESTPDFDVNTLPGIAGRRWQETAGGSWFATVMPGKGEAVDSGNGTVTVSMSMWTEDGTEILTLHEGGRDLILPVGQDMFPGWNETLAGMKIGEMRKIAVPWEQTRGDDGQPLIQTVEGSGDQQMLVADVKLIEINPAGMAPEQPLASAGS